MALSRGRWRRWVPATSVRGVEVDQVADERAGDGADADDGGDDTGRSAEGRAGFSWGCGGLHLEEEASFGVEHHGG